MRIPFTDKMIWARVWDEHGELLQGAFIITIILIWLASAVVGAALLTQHVAMWAGITFLVLYIPISVAITMYMQARQYVMDRVRDRLSRG